MKILSLFAIFTSLFLVGCSQNSTINEKLESQNAQISSVEQKFLRDNLVTNTAKISIPFEEILSGGPQKDGIPAINNPKFVPVSEAREKMNYLIDDALGIVVSINDTNRFYPYNILNWHEIVNDTFGNNKISVTFCPLCGSAIVYNRIIDGEEVLFGVSGKLWQSNLLMYDNLTESLWSQSLGEAVVGDKLGSTLEVIDSDLLTFKEFKTAFPNGEVLSDDTGFSRNYGFAPYGDYDTNDRLIFPVNNTDTSLPKKEIMYVVNLENDTTIAFVREQLADQWVGTIRVGNTTYTATYNNGDITVEDGHNILPWYHEMWFSWITQHDAENRYVWTGE